MTVGKVALESGFTTALQVETDVVGQAESLANLLESGLGGVFEQIQDDSPLINREWNASHLAGEHQFEVVYLLENAELLRFQCGPCSTALTQFQLASSDQVRLFLDGTLMEKQSLDFPVQLFRQQF